MDVVVYVLCALTGSVCAYLLLRSYRRNRLRLLLWSGVCFTGLALNNVLLFVDKVLVADTDLSLLRSASALAAVLVLLYGLIWETR
ncbi:MAG: DUF5985 family protein [Solirubrobacteraceae bacterium]